MLWGHVLEYYIGFQVYSLLTAVCPPSLRENGLFIAESTVITFCPSSVMWAKPSTEISQNESSLFNLFMSDSLSVIVI